MVMKILENEAFSTFDIEMLHGDDISKVDVSVGLKFSIVGPTIDERCSFCLEYLDGKTKVYRVEYDSTNFVLRINNTQIQINELPKFIKDEGWTNDSIIIDATSVNVVELLLLIDAFEKTDVHRFEVLYAEPKNYVPQGTRPRNRRDFKLSEKYDGYKGVPMFSKMTREADAKVFCCGYEAARIQNAIETLPIGTSDTYLLFGMPPFYVGWDMNAYYNHINFLVKENLHNISYCGATNPLSVMMRLLDIYKTLLPDQNMFIAPVGTKPMSLAVCLFLVKMASSNKCALLFDHPEKSSARSKEVGEVNLYRIQL